ncbi:MAG: hypothetical protein DHS20C02_10540 [Micavibrio sp.]|nr:MAG: hypothetical protein DHS20C02_10540 [Micavibrio sp.]
MVYGRGMKRPIVTCSSILILFLLTACLGAQSPAPVSHYGRSQGAGSAGIHTVVHGDTLWSISQRYNMAQRDIAVKNKLNAPFALIAGQRLWLPPPMEYKVRQGDTLYEVSRVFGVNTNEIARLNNLRSPYIMKPGQVLQMPSVTRKTIELEQEGYEVATTSRALPTGTVEREVLGAPGPTTKPGKAPVKQAAIDPAHKGTIKPKPKSKISKRTPKRSSGKFLHPVKGEVISRYGPKKSGLHNDGINIKAPRGTPVRAAENGVVVYAGSELKGSGNLVLVRHDGRWMSAYAHMDKTMIKRGDTIKRGQTIGTVGTSGSVSTPQLHFELRRGTEAINPDRYLEG